MEDQLTLENEKQSLKTRLQNQINDDGPTVTDVAKSMGFEVSANLATDFATGWLAPVAPLYAAINFASGLGANLIAQKIRGEKGFKFGEALASGGLATIPLMDPTLGRTATKLVGNPWSIQRAVVGGAGLGIAQRQLEAGIDEQRLISPTEAALSFGVGGAGGAGGKVIGDALGRKLINIIKGKPIDPYDPVNWIRKGTIAAQRAPIPERKLVSLRKSRNFKQLSDDEKSNVIEMIGDLDAYINERLKEPGFNPSKPSIGYIGPKDITTNGKVLSIRPKKGEYVLFNKTANQAIRSKRNIWDQPSSAEKGRVSNEFIWNSKKEYNADAKKILDHLLNSKHPEDQDLYYRIVGGTKPFQGEHIQYQKAGGNDPVWIEQPDGTFRHRSKLNAEGEPLAPGDVENLRLVGIYDFKYLKDGLENYMEKGIKPLNNDYYLEMDRSNNIIIMHNKTGQYPDGQPFIRDTPVSPSTMDPNVVRENWANDRDVTGLISIHRSSSKKEGIKAFDKIINRHSMEIKPEGSTDYRAAFDSWFLDTEGGMAARELPGWDKVTKQLIEIDTNITRLRTLIIKTKDLKVKNKRLEQLRSYEEEALMLMKRHIGRLGTTVSIDGRQYPNIPLSTDDMAGQ